MEIKQALHLIQQKLEAPKTQFHGYGKFAYRSCEDILKAVKPLLEETKTNLVLQDEIVNIGSRYYVKATASLINLEGESFAVNSYAREEEDKKGMDGSQITGASSSYARKYALNGLFGIDDTKDSDKTNKGLGGASRPLKTPSTSNFDKAKGIISKTDDKNILEDTISKIAVSDKYSDEEKEVLVKMIEDKLSSNEN